jgi:hypothetical protein
MRQISVSRALGAFAVVLIAQSVHAVRPCPPDIDCSGAVNVTDMLSVINNWGGTGVSDVNFDGIVNVGDLLAVVNSWGPCVMDFGTVFANTEAHQIGLEMLGSNGPLTLDQEKYDRIVRDLGLIRTAHPSLADQFHSLAWAPNQMLVSVLNPQSADYLCHNTYYRVTNIQPLFSTWYTLTFAGKVNVPRLAQIYMANASISFAEPNGFVGGQNYWEPTDLGGGTWRWHIDDGWHDCFDGCDCHREYVIDIDLAGNLTLVSFQEYGASWCDFGNPD